MKTDYYKCRREGHGQNDAEICGSHASSYLDCRTGGSSKPKSMNFNSLCAGPEKEVRRCCQKNDYGTRRVAIASEATIGAAGRT
ncbi:hypothetical protein [Nonomuraea sp. NPDC049646]|uniref:hypothetical protein n=1 Tax=unclassified Nonomuraea TaxID=2593643 RepID=UPI0037A1CCFD